MKKLLFIIPIVRCSVFTILIICFQAIKVAARTDGCHVSFAVAERLFYTPYPAGGANAWITTGVIDASGATGGYRDNGSATYGCISDMGAACTVYQQYEISAGPPQVVGVRVYKYGVYATIDPVNCPIDDYMPLLAIFTLSLVIIKIRSPYLMFCANENHHNHRSI